MQSVFMVSDVTPFGKTDDHLRIIDTSPDYSPMLAKHEQTVSSLRGNPLPAALNGPLPWWPPNLNRLRLRLSRGSLNLNLNLNLRTAPRLGKREKPGRTESRRTKTVRSQRAGTFKVSHCDWRFKGSGYATLPGSDSERDLSRLIVIGPERQRPIAPA
jgi:hypothetical protein